MLDLPAITQQAKTQPESSLDASSPLADNGDEDDGVKAALAVLAPTRYHGVLPRCFTGTVVLLAIYS